MLLLPTREDPLTNGFYDLIAAYTQDRQKFTLCVNSLDECLPLRWNGSSLKTKVVSLLHSVETPVLSAVLCPRCPPCLVWVLSGVSSRLGVSERTGSLCGLEVPVGKHCLPLAVLRDVKERGCKAGSRVARAFPGL